MKFKEKLDQMKGRITAVFLAYKRKDTPVPAKIVAGITVGYALSPIDLIPDFIPILGYLDDLIVLPVLIILCVKLIPCEIMQECEEQAKDIWKDGKPKSWIYAIPVMVFWLLIFGIIVLNIFI